MRKNKYRGGKRKSYHHKGRHKSYKKRGAKQTKFYTVARGGIRL